MDQIYKNVQIKTYPKKGIFRANVYPLFKTPTRGSLQIGSFKGDTEAIVLKRAMEDIDKYFDRWPEVRGRRGLFDFYSRWPNFGSQF